MSRSATTESETPTDRLLDVAGRAGHYARRALRRFPRPRVPRRVVLGSLAIHLLAVPLVLWGWPQARREAAHVFGYVRAQLEGRDRVAADILVDIRATLPRGASQSELVDAVRRYVHAHSLHLMDAEHLTYTRDVTEILRRLRDAGRGEGRRPHLACGSRARAMRALVGALALESRLVGLYTDDFDGIEGHTLVEVRNAETARWELQDPDLNLHFVDLETGLRVSAAAFVWQSTQRLRTVPADAAEGELLLAHYFEAVMYYQPESGAPPVVLVNVDRLSSAPAEALRASISAGFPSAVFIENHGIGAAGATLATR
jgi:hypothetical protein